MNRILIAGVQSGVGKTTVTIGLMAALVKRGMRVRGFKVGPDYLDPTYYAQITGQKAYNLDGWMTGKGYARRLFTEMSSGSDISIVEGVMGLYDGFGAVSEDGSTAQIAKWLGAPVILVVDAKGMSRSVCALLKGYIQFDKKTDIKGVVFNNLGSERHLDLLKEAVAVNLDIPVLGGLLKDESIRLPERHLGLFPATEGSLNKDVLRKLVSQMEKRMDLDTILSLAGKAPALSLRTVKPLKASKKKRCKIGVAHDAAFNFYYEDNFQILQRAGAEIVFFSPINGKSLPKGVNGLYLGGGYPERYARELSMNGDMLKNVREFAGSGKPVYAECGGLIYLSSSIRLKDGEKFPLVGTFPFDCRMRPKRRALGYVEVKVGGNTILGEQGMVFRGHEFHYSEIIRVPASVGKKYSVSKRKGEGEVKEGYSVKNTLGTFVHAHFGSQPRMAENLVEACCSQKHQ